MNEYPNRKSPRADWYDYGGGMYFLTAVCDQRIHYFGHIEEDKMHFTAIGQYLHQVLSHLEDHYDYLHVVDFVVMPNHFHLLVYIDDDKAPKNSRSASDVHAVNSRQSRSVFYQQVSSCNGNVSKLIRNIKSLISRFAHDYNLEFGWQRSFHDHIVRDRQQQDKIALYIMKNIANWEDDCFNKSS